MANIADTSFKVLGTRKAVQDLWNTLQNLGVNSKHIWLGDIAEHYGIDWQNKGIMVRGSIYWAEYEEKENEDYYLLSFDTESAWNEPDELFNEINRILGNELEINYRVIECGCEVFYVHQESGIDFFPEECCVTSSGGPFDEVYEDTYATVADAIQEWCDKMQIERGDRPDEEMVKFIEDFEYEDDCTYFNIYEFQRG